MLLKALPTRLLLPLAMPRLLLQRPVKLPRRLLNKPCTASSEAC